ncbi:hypothetical protein IW150_005572 [Coemansia sp. RSA 2607]|nr:hypothetical protein IW150_005572 [Coemansia sp. RSA 2607]
MDRKCLVGAIVSRACFRPFMEWCCIEESRFKKQQQQQTLETRDSLDLRPERSPVLGSPYQAASAKDADILRTDEFIRANGLCPSAAFWPRRPVLGNAVAAVANSGDANTDFICSVSEIPYGWRIAREAVDRVDARLSYNATRTTDTTSSHNGKDVDDDDDLVAKQFGILWEAATSKDRLAKMFMGWAPWV